MAKKIYEKMKTQPVMRRPKAEATAEETTPWFDQLDDAVLTQICYEVLHDGPGGAATRTGVEALARLGQTCRRLRAAARLPDVWFADGGSFVWAAAGDPPYTTGTRLDAPGLAMTIERDAEDERGVWDLLRAAGRIPLVELAVVDRKVHSIHHEAIYETVIRAPPTLRRFRLACHGQSAGMANDNWSITSAVGVEYLDLSGAWPELYEGPCADGLGRGYLAQPCHWVRELTLRAWSLEALEDIVAGYPGLRILTVPAGIVLQVRMMAARLPECAGLEVRALPETN